MTFPSLNIEKLRHDTIQKVKKEKQDKENAKKLQETIRLSELSKFITHQKIIIF